MSTVTADVQATDPPRVDVTADDIAVGDTVTLYRLVDGTRTPLRGAVNRQPSAGTLVVIDQEAPFGEPVAYVLADTAPDGSVVETTSNTVTLTADLPWITHPVTGVGVAVSVVDWPELDYEARQNAVLVAGRPRPVVISDVRTAPSSTLTVLTRTRSQLEELRSLLNNGDTLLLRPVAEAVEGDYLAIGKVTETRVKANSRPWDPNPAGKDWRRLVAMECQAVDPPDTRLAAVGDTLEDLYEYVGGDGTTLADLADAFGPDATLLTIAQTPLTVGAS